MAGWTDVTSKYHDMFLRAMMPYRNEVLERSQIIKIIESVPALKDYVQFVYPSDHCINHTNKGACTCALTGKAIFERIGRAKYKVL